MRRRGRVGSLRPAALLFLALVVLLSACVVRRAAVTMNLSRQKGSPRDASVYIDEQFVGFLGVVAARGVRLPEGEHRITVRRDGYFPWDQLVESDRQTIRLNVKLRKIPL